DQPHLKRESHPHSRHSRVKPGSVEDILRDIEPLIFQVSHLTAELVERKREIRGNSNDKAQVRTFADMLYSDGDLLLEIVRDDPGAVLSASSDYSTDIPF